jgi:hypothetical protein
MESPAPTPRPGDQLASTVCGTRVIVIRAPAAGAPGLECGGKPMMPAADAPAVPSDTGEQVTLLGKRYVDAADTLELLCTQPGSGRLTLDGEPLAVKTAKPLPASD